MRSDDPGDDRPEQDRVVSRRVDHPTEAIREDEPGYPDPPASAPPHRPEPGGAGTTERAAQDMAENDQSEPTRSE